MPMYVKRNDAGEFEAFDCTKRLAAWSVTDGEGKTVTVDEATFARLYEPAERSSGPQRGDFIEAVRAFEAAKASRTPAPTPAERSKKK